MMRKKKKKRRRRELIITILKESHVWYSERICVGWRGHARTVCPTCGQKRNTSLLALRKVTMMTPSCPYVAGTKLYRLSQLEPELGDAAKKILLYDKVLKNLKADVEKFRDMVQDICFHQIILSQGFETIFNRSDNNEDIQEHHQRSVKLANTVRGKFETSLRKKVLDLISKHLEKNKAQLQETLSWYKDVNSKLTERKEQALRSRPAFDPSRNEHSCTKDNDDAEKQA